MNGFFDIPPPPEWRIRARRLVIGEMIRNDFFALLPYIYEEYDESCIPEFEAYERYYIRAINDGNNALVDNFIRIINYRLANGDELGEQIADYIGSRLDLEINFSKKKSGTRYLKFGPGIQGRGKFVADRRRKLILTLHIYFLYLNDNSEKSEDFVLPKIAGQIEEEAKGLQTRIGRMPPPPSSTYRLYLDEIDTLLAKDQISSLHTSQFTKDYWKFSERLWAIRRSKTTGPSITRSLLDELIPEFDETPKSVLASYLEALYPANSEVGN